jgi:hypothetical protein
VLRVQLSRTTVLFAILWLICRINCGLAFEATLRQKVQEWSKRRSTRTLAQMKGLQLLMPFLELLPELLFFSLLA